MNDTNDDALSISLDEQTSDQNLRSRLDLIEVLKTRAANDPANRLFVRLLQDSEVLVQQVAIMALKDRRDTIGVLLQDLISLLDHTQERVRWAACELLSELGTDASVALRKIQEMEPNAIVARAIWRISQRQDLIVPILLRSMEEPTEDVCDLICELGPDASPTVPLLRRGLEIDDADLKWAIVDALGAIGPGAVEAVPDLIRLLDYASGVVASRAAHALACIGAMSVTGLVSALKSKDARTLEFAADALSQIGEAARPAVPHLRDLLKHGNADVAAWAAVALGTITTDQSLVSILTDISDQSANEFLREKAMEALEGIDLDGQDTGGEEAT